MQNFIIILGISALSAINLAYPMPAEPVKEKTITYVFYQVSTCKSITVECTPQLSYMQALELILDASINDPTEFISEDSRVISVKQN